jgi:hypothetical protein
MQDLCPQTGNRRPSLVSRLEVGGVLGAMSECRKSCRGKGMKDGENEDPGCHRVERFRLDTL